MIPANHATCICALILIGFGLVSAPVQASQVAQDRPVQTLCRSQVAWHIADIDPRFNMSREALTDTMTEGTQLWNQAAGTPLFVRTRDQGIAVSLIFDHRQALYDQLREMFDQAEQLRKDIAQADQDLAVLNAEIDELNTRIDSENQQLQALQQDFEALRDRHANRRGQVPSSVMPKLQTLQAASQEIHEQLQNRIREAERVRYRFNTHVAERNLVAEQYTSLVNDLNRRSAAQGADTNVGEHGIFIRQRGRNVEVAEEQIHVFRVSSQEALLTILAHELGHAIGINHLPEPDAIMTARLESQLGQLLPQQLSNADKRALRVVCQRVAGR